jgi:putative membrane protein
MNFFLKLILNWVILTFSISLTSYILPFISISGKTPMEGIRIAFMAGILLGLVNLAIKPVVKLLSLPINLLTLGLFNILINAGMLWIVAYFVKGLTINGFWGHIISSVLISVFSIVLAKIIIREGR